MPADVILRICPNLLTYIARLDIGRTLGVGIYVSWFLKKGCWNTSTSKEEDFDGYFGAEIKAARKML